MAVPRPVGLRAESQAKRARAPPSPPALLLGPESREDLWDHHVLERATRLFSN